LRPSGGGFNAMTPSTFEHTATALSVSTAIVQIALIGIILKRKMQSEFPVFLVYMTGAVVTDLALSAYVAAFGASSHRYFWLYWAFNAVLMILGFGVLSEIMKVGLKPYAGLIDLGKLLFRWAALFLLLAGGLTALATIGPTSAKCLAAVRLLERSLLMMQCGLLLLFFLFEKRLSLSWRSYPVSLALGLGTSSALVLSFSFLRVQFPAWSAVIGLADNVTYLVVALFWAVCFALPEPARRNVLDSPSKLIFQRWNEALTTYGYGGGTATVASNTVDSFLPGIEKTVDRVLARKIAN
jgi:hypothetical protein